MDDFAEFGAVQRVANLVDLEKPCKMTTLCIWLLSWLSIQPRIRAIQKKFDHFWMIKFFEIYKICNPLHRSDRKIWVKNASQFWRFWIIYSKLFIQNLHFSNLKCDFLSKFWWNFVGISRTCSECQEFSISWKKRIQFFEKSVKISEMFKLFRKLFRIIQSCP